ncbi:MAG TPA: phosphoglucosamine mutase [Nitrososphaeraceae archaeon]|nr:phosphoglucosamine mutase [Nitrososphaeraceae archaeon]
MQNNNPRLFGTNGVRGVFGEELTLNVVVDLSYSLATYFKKGPIIIGYDGRKSSPILSKIVSSVINSAGIDVDNAGLVPTPCLQYAAKRVDYNGGIMITASHNPPEYNGIKPTANDGVEISREDELKVEEIYYSKRFSKIDGFGTDYTNETIIDSYIKTVLSLVNVEKIRQRKFTVAMDIGNGAQARVAPVLLNKLGCKLITINGNIDGDFPGRGSEPTPENLMTLSNMVKNSEADFGVAYDGDGDRSLFCDEEGKVHWGDMVGTAIVRYLLKTKHRGAEVVCPINTTMALSLVAKEADSKVIHTKVGSVEVSREMLRRKSFIGLEDNGGFMYGKLNEVRDGAMTTALVLEMLSLSDKEEQTLSHTISLLPKIFQYKTKFKCPTRQIANTIVTMCIEHGSPKKIETLDGAKIWIDEETWIMVRPSGTEPFVRMYAESVDSSLLNSKVSEYRRLIESKISNI